MNKRQKAILIYYSILFISILISLPFVYSELFPLKGPDVRSEKQMDNRPVSVEQGNTIDISLQDSSSRERSTEKSNKIQAWTTQKPDEEIDNLSGKHHDYQSGRIERSVEDNPKGKNESDKKSNVIRRKTYKVDDNRASVEDGNTIAENFTALVIGEQRLIEGNIITLIRYDGTDSDPKGSRVIYPTVEIDTTTNSAYLKLVSNDKIFISDRIGLPERGRNIIERKLIGTSDPLLMNKQKLYFKLSSD